MNPQTTIPTEYGISTNGGSLVFVNDYGYGYLHLLNDSNGDAWFVKFLPDPLLLKMPYAVGIVVCGFTVNNHSKHRLPQRTNSQTTIPDCMMYDEVVVLE